MPYGNRNCWDCPHCEQYNGFQEVRAEWVGSQAVGAGLLGQHLKATCSLAHPRVGGRHISLRWAVSRVLASHAHLTVVLAQHFI